MVGYPLTHYSNGRRRPSIALVKNAAIQKADSHRPKVSLAYDLGIDVGVLLLVGDLLPFDFNVEFIRAFTHVLSRQGNESLKAALSTPGTFSTSSMTLL